MTRHRDSQTAQSSFLTESQKRDGSVNYFDLNTTSKQMIRKLAGSSYLQTNPQWFLNWCQLRRIEEANRHEAEEFVGELLGARMSVVWTNAVSAVNNPRAKRRKMMEPTEEGGLCECGKAKSQLWVCEDCESVSPSCYPSAED
jgi:hypothetical protein